MMQPSRCVILCASLVLAACGSSPRPQSAAPADPPPAAVQQPAGNETAARTDDAAQAQPPAEDMARHDVPDSMPEAETDREQPPAAERAPAVTPAVLGRPDWWFTDIRYSETRVRACAEAAGPTVREARRRAIDSARERLVRELGREPSRDAVAMATVLPLPAADAGPDAARYIGYVLMEALLQ